MVVANKTSIVSRLREVAEVCEQEGLSFDWMSVEGDFVTVGSIDFIRHFKSRMYSLEDGRTSDSCFASVVVGGVKFRTWMLKSEVQLGNRS